MGMEMGNKLGNKRRTRDRDAKPIQNSVPVFPRFPGHYKQKQFSPII
jgi:hypothetical protein